MRDDELVEQRGEPPELGWLLAFLDGSEHLDPACPATNTPGDVMWARLPRAGVDRRRPGGPTAPSTSASASASPLLARIVDDLRQLTGAIGRRAEGVVAGGVGGAACRAVVDR